LKNLVNTKVIGNNGEDRATNYLLEHGFAILKRNFRTKSGEIDIIALSGELLVFVEVKTLPSGNFDTLEAELGKIKQKRIIETAKYFLLNNRQYNNNIIRFDVVVVDMPGLDPIYHIENAFSEFL